MMFGAITTAGSGLHLYRTWLDAVSDNISNMNDAVPTSKQAFQERFVTAQAGTTLGSGVQSVGVQYGSGAGQLVHEPSNPNADGDGMVRYPDIDLGDQMAQLMLAQRGYQSNLAVIQRARDAYAQALTIGR